VRDHSRGKRERKPHGDASKHPCHDEPP
jgi:hypothetical protein